VAAAEIASGQQAAGADREGKDEQRFFAPVARDRDQGALAGGRANMPLPQLDPVAPAERGRDRVCGQPVPDGRRRRDIIEDLDLADLDASGIGCRRRLPSHVGRTQRNIDWRHQSSPVR
jgi:hypothetical protein